ncbi:MAG: hypothetical protein H0V98_09765 [Chloroflexia bacterium]|nr:hypothetical protein [Chloroflexia bacterium]
MAGIHGVEIDCADPLKLAELGLEEHGNESRMKEDDEREQIKGLGATTLWCLEKGE